MRLSRGVAVALAAVAATTLVSLAFSLVYLGRAG